MDIHWFPGHMAKSRRLIKESLKVVDVIIELLDARIPQSSQMSHVDELAGSRPRVVVLNKSDLADETQNRLWAEFFTAQGKRVILANALMGTGLKDAAKAARDLMTDKVEKWRERGRQNVPVRGIVVGIPNVGKSTFINKTVGATRAKASDRPGVTRGLQWIKVMNGFELLDTPGVLAPKLSGENMGLHLAFTGAVKDNIIDIEQLGATLVSELIKLNPDAVNSRYKTELSVGGDIYELLEAIGRARGFLLSGGRVDLRRTAEMVLDEYRAGKIGRFTLEPIR